MKVPPIGKNVVLEIVDPFGFMECEFELAKDAIFLQYVRLYYMHAKYVNFIVKISTL